MSDKIAVSASEVRSWARENGYEVGGRGHLPKEVVAAFNRRHRKREFVNSNPWLGSEG